MIEGKTYNERLFAGNSLRSRLHRSRFYWFADQLETLSLDEYRVIELGCFDGRLLQCFERSPKRYLGLDADWEGGLTQAQEIFKNQPELTFELATDPSSMEKLPDDSFNLGASLETLEHVPPAMVDGYLRQLARVIDGYLLITVPNEKGLVFLTKWLAKKLLGHRVQAYRWSEVVAAALGRMDRVGRDDHKGFDYRALINEVAVHFDIVSISGAPTRLPLWLSFNICIVAKSKKDRQAT